MNKTMQNMMKPIRTYNASSKAARRLAQEEAVLNIMSQLDYSPSARDISDNDDSRNIPTLYDYPTNYRSTYRTGVRGVSTILKRLERKGRVISTLYGSHRYYSIPLEGGEN